MVLSGVWSLLGGIVGKGRQGSSESTPGAPSSRDGTLTPNHGDECTLSLSYLESLIFMCTHPLQSNAGEEATPVERHRESGDPLSSRGQATILEMKFPSFQDLLRKFCMDLLSNYLINPLHPSRGPIGVVYQWRPLG